MANTPEKKNKKKEIKAPAAANGSYKSDKRVARETAKKQEIKIAAIKKIVTVCVSCVLAAAILITGGIVAYNAVLDNGVLMRSRVAMETDDFKVTNAMMSYYIFDKYNTLIDKIGEDSASAYKIDINKSLKKQQYNNSSSMTWFEHFLSTCIDETENMLLMLEGAKRDSITLTAEEEAAVKADAGKLDPKKYGRGVRSSDIEAAMLFRALADKYSEWLKSSIEVTDEEIDAYIEEHKDEFLEVSYRYYVIKYDIKEKEDSDSSSSNVSGAEGTASTGSTADVESVTSDSTSSGGSSSSSETEKIGRDRVTAKELAKQLEACKTEEEFLNKITELFATEEMTEEEKQDLIEDSLYEGLKKNDSIELNKWAFDGETELLDTKNIEDTTNGSFTVYMLTSAPAVNESKVANIRRILISELEEEEEETETEESEEAEKTDETDYKAIAEEIYNTWKNGDATAESFSALADEKSDDKKYDGGIYENCFKGTFSKEVDAWIYAEDRKAGDTVLLEDENGWNILYFESLGESQTDFTAREDIFDEKYDLKLEEIEDENTVFFHYNYMNSIPA